MHNEEELEDKPEPDIDEQIQRLVEEQPSNMLSGSLLDTNSASQLKEGGVKSSHFKKSSHFTKAIAFQVAPSDPDDKFMPALEMDSCEIIHEKPQLENDSYEICEVM